MKATFTRISAWPSTRFESNALVERRLGWICPRCNADDPPRMPEGFCSFVK